MKPQLRFPEFTDDWEEIELGKLGTFTKGANLSKADISETGTPFILYGELYTTYDEVAYDIKRKTEAKVDEKYYSKIGDVLIPTSGETAEEISKATCVMQDGVILAGDLNIFRNDTVDGRIISYIINYQIKRNIARIAQGKSIVHIQAKNLSKIKIKYPKNKAEQKKIIDCISSADDLISVFTKELKNLEELKKGVMQKIFSQEVRFKREDGTDYPDWEEKKLGEVLTQRRDIQTISEKAPLLAFTIEDGVIDPKDKKTNKRDFLIKDKENKKFQLTKYDDIIYNPANIKFGAIHRNKFGEGVVSPIYVILKTNQNPSFVEYSLKRESFISKTKKYLEGTVEKLRTLKSENFLSLSVFLPCLEEQEKIGSFLSDIDEVILASDQEVKKLQELKKGAMQKIFSQEVRFKRDDGTYYPDWEEICFGDILYECKEKTDDKEKYPLYSLTLEDGVIPKPERYEREFLVKNTENAYKIAPSNSFVYNPMNLRFGTLKVNHENFDVCVSGYYNIFKLKNEETIGFWENFLVSKDMLNYYFYIAKGSLLEKLRVHFSQFVKIKKNLPCLEEQQKIGYFLSDFDEAISLAKQELEKWKLLKKGLLQQMFT